MKVINDLITQYKALHFEEVVNYEQLNKVLITSHSTRIEGSTLTFMEAVELVEKTLTPAGKPLSYSLQTLDHYEALCFVLSQAEQQLPLSVAFIQEIAAKVMQRTGEVFTNINGTVDASKGELRRTGVQAGATIFMKWQKVPEALDELISKLNQRLALATTAEQQLTLAFDAHYELVHIHPFLDGNGRTARLLMNYIQAYYRLPLGLIFEEDKQSYYAALQSVQEHGDHEHYYAFMFAQYEKYLKGEINRANP